MTLDILDVITFLLFVSAIFSFVNYRLLKLPSTIGLMIQSLLISIIILATGSWFPDFKSEAKLLMQTLDFTEVLFTLMLSFLLFAGALDINHTALYKEKWPILILATVGTLLSTFLISTAVYFVFPLLGVEIAYVYCLLFGALISPTDPIAVLAMIKKSTIPISKSLEIKIAGESLFNDGVGVVVYATILGAAGLAGHGGGHEEASVGVLSVLQLFGQEVIGGLGLGLVLGYLGQNILRVIDDEYVELEVIVTLVMVLGGNRIAEVFHFSSPLAMVAMGLVVGRVGKDGGKRITSEYVYKFWHLVDELLNAILFVLIGFEVLVITIQLDYLLAGLISIVIALAARLISVGLPIQLLRLRRGFEKRTTRILTWGGLRGGISVALALSLPEEMGEAKPLIISATYCVVTFSILVQGLTIRKLFEAAAND